MEKREGVIFVHSNLLAMVENAALKSHIFQAQNDMVASLLSCFSSYLSLKRELWEWYVTVQHPFPNKTQT